MTGWRVPLLAGLLWQAASGQICQDDGKEWLKLIREQPEGMNEMGPLNTPFQPWQQDLYHVFPYSRVFHGSTRFNLDLHPSLPNIGRPIERLNNSFIIYGGISGDFNISSVNSVSENGDNVFNRFTSTTNRLQTSRYDVWLLMAFDTLANETDDVIDNDLFSVYYRWSMIGNLTRGRNCSQESETGCGSAGHSLNSFQTLDGTAAVTVGGASWAQDFPANGHPYDMTDIWVLQQKNIHLDWADINDVPIVPETLVWDKLDMSTSSVEVPEPRVWHTATTVQIRGAAALVVIGGADITSARGGEGCVFDCPHAGLNANGNQSPWLLTFTSDMRSFVWSRLDTIGGPGARYGHTAVEYNNDVFVYGGVSTQCDGMSDEAFAVRGRTLWRLSSSGDWDTGTTAWTAIKEVRSSLTDSWTAFAQGTVLNEPGNATVFVTPGQLQRSNCEAGQSAAESAGLLGISQQYWSDGGDYHSLTNPISFTPKTSNTGKNFGFHNVSTNQSDATNDVLMDLTMASGGAQRSSGIMGQTIHQYLKNGRTTVVFALGGLVSMVGQLYPTNAVFALNPHSTQKLYRWAYQLDHPRPNVHAAVAAVRREYPYQEYFAQVNSTSTRVYQFGGNEVGGGPFNPSATLWLLHTHQIPGYLTKGYWEPVIVSESIKPSARMWHSFTSAVDHNMQPTTIAILFGGIGSANDTNQISTDCLIDLNIRPYAIPLIDVDSDLWLWNGQYFEWTNLASSAAGPKPACRFGHTTIAVPAGKHMNGTFEFLIHGGWTTKNVPGATRFYNATPFLHFNCSAGCYLLNDTWKLVVTLQRPNHPATAQWSRLQTNLAPEHRVSAAAASVRLYGVVNGGLVLAPDGRSLESTNSTWFFNFNTSQWYKLELNSPLSSTNRLGPRYAHQLVTMGLYSAMLFGGMTYTHTSGIVNASSMDRKAWILSPQVLGPDGTPTCNSQINVAAEAARTPDYDYYNNYWFLAWSEEAPDGYGVLSFTAATSLLTCKYSMALFSGGMTNGGGYRFYGMGTTSYNTSCPNGYGYNQECYVSACQTTSDTALYAFDCMCEACPQGTYAATASPICEQCPGFGYTTVGSMNSIMNCTVCKPGTCSGGGTCDLLEPTSGIFSCSCNFGYSGVRCETNWGTPVLAVSGLAVFLVILSVGYLLWKRSRTLQDLKYAGGLRERLLEDTIEEVENLKQAWVIDPSELELGHRIDKGSEGAQGAVFVATYKTFTVAVKQLRTAIALMDSASLEDFSREVDVLRIIRHRNVVLFMGAGFDDITVDGESVRLPFLVVEYMARGSLLSNLADPTLSLPWDRRWKLAADAACGLCFLHSQQPARIHRDVKSANMLITADWRLKLGDFGTAALRQIDNERRGSISEAVFAQRRGWFGKKRGSKRMTDHFEGSDGDGPLTMNPTFVGHMMASELNPHATYNMAFDDVFGTLAWMAPEVIGRNRSQMFRPTIDTYSFGVVLWELATRAVPWNNPGFYQSATDIEMAVLGGKRPDSDPVTKSVPDEGQEFIRLGRVCWTANPNERPTFGQIEAYIAEAQQRGRISGLPSVADESSA